MLETSQEALSYLKFLSLVQEVRVSSDFKQLSPIEERLLNHLAAVWNTEQKITVLQAMSVDREISHSTAHRLLKCLRMKQFVMLLNDERDTRVKYVLPTEKANAYFATMGQCLHQALEATSI